MKRAAILSGAGVVLLMVGAAAAQPGVSITAPSPEQLERRVPRHERSYTDDHRRDAGGRGVHYAPVFIGPTVKSETTELGFSAWIAPNDTIGLQPGDGDVSGWPALGVTFSWGGPPRRPSAGRSIR
jgi:hypothetical protein